MGAEPQFLKTKGEGRAKKARPFDIPIFSSRRDGGRAQSTSITAKATTSSPAETFISRTP